MKLSGNVDSLRFVPPHLSDPPFDMLLSDFFDTRSDCVLSRRKLLLSAALPGDVCGELLDPLLPPLPPLPPSTLLSLWTTAYACSNRAAPLPPSSAPPAAVWHSLSISFPFGVVVAAFLEGGLKELSHLKWLCFFKMELYRLPDQNRLSFEIHEVKRIF